MRIGVPTEIKNNENRVALTPTGAAELIEHGHRVVVERGAGEGSGLADAAYAAAGAELVDDADELWDACELVLKVKEPIAAEHHRLREGQILFAYLHLAASIDCTRAVLDSGVTAIAYETVQLPDRTLPLLQPMSEVAGRLAPQVGAYHLLRAAGGRGILFGGIAGVPKARVVVIGGGVAGEHAAANALGMGADVTILDVSIPRLRALEQRFDGAVHTRRSSAPEVAAQVATADLVIGAVLVPGRQAPRLVTDEMIAGMRPGAVLVDIAIDQGGCVEGSRPTTHDDPTFRIHDALLYGVANMPGAVPETSTRALTNATLPYVLALADGGFDDAVRADPALAAGVAAHGGNLTSAGVASAFGMRSVRVERLLDPAA